MRVSQQPWQNRSLHHTIYSLYDPCICGCSKLLHAVNADESLSSDIHVTTTRSAMTAMCGFPPEAFDVSRLPDYDHEFIESQDLAAFETALQAPDPLQSPTAEDGPRSPRSPTPSVTLTKRNSNSGFENYDNNDEDNVDAVLAAANAAGGEVNTAGGQGTFFTAQNDWAPVNSRFYRRKRAKRRKGTSNAVEGLLGTRTKDETREGYLYQLSKWPLLLFVFAWLGGLALAYLSTRWYIWVYEHFFTWRGRRQTLRRNLRGASTYQEWVAAARELDAFLGRKTWREENEYAYYDSKTVKRVWDQLKKLRARVEAEEGKTTGNEHHRTAVEDLKSLIEACVKNNFVGVENSRLYSQTYYGTKNLVQNFIDEGK